MDSGLSFRIRIRTHVDRDNREGFEPFFVDLARELGADDRFDLYLRHVSRLGGDNDAAIPVLGDDEREVVAALKDRARELGVRLRAEGGHDPCYAAAANSFVIRSTGEIAKCTVAFDHPNNNIGRLNPDGSASVDGFV